MSVCVTRRERIQIRLRRTVPNEYGVLTHDRPECCQCLLEIRLLHSARTRQIAHVPCIRNTFIDAMLSIGFNRFQPGELGLA